MPSQLYVSLSHVVSRAGCGIRLYRSLIIAFSFNNRLKKYFDYNKVINETQIGFQPKVRTSDHMFVLGTLIEKYQFKP